MPQARYGFVYKVDNAETLPRGASPVMYAYFDSDLHAQAFRDSLAPYLNGVCVSLTKQIDGDVTFGDGPYGDAKADGGSDFLKATIKESGADGGNVDQITIPFVKENVSKQIIEQLILQADGLTNKNGHEVVSVVRVVETQSIKGDPETLAQPALPTEGGG